MTRQAIPGAIALCVVVSTSVVCAGAFSATRPELPPTLGAHLRLIMELVIYPWIFI